MGLRSNLFRNAIILSLLSFSLFSLGCSQVSFSPGKQAVLKSNAFADGEQSEYVDPDDNYNDNDDDRTQSPEEEGDGDQSPEDYVDGDQEIQFPLERNCSDSKSEKYGNVQWAEKVVVRVFDGSDLICEDLTTDYKSDIINLDKVTVDLSDCTFREGEHYDVRFFDISASNMKDELGEIEIEVKNGKVELKDSRMEILYATNPREDNYNESTTEDFARCDSYNSPLVMKMGAEPIRLSSPLDGILFDLLGENNNHVKKQISWPVDDAVAFIALPNHNGRVLGINELFGDNTKGPDGSFSAHGYEALAKHDDNFDGVIDQRDAVFSKLRLFFDRNRDGVSQSSELESLSAHDIESIDLAFDATYTERDKYGNKILFKSVAKTKTDYLLVFDIWFRLID